VVHRHIVFFWLFTLLVTAAVAQTTTPTSPSARPGDTPVDLADYRIGPEDVLDISVWKEEGLKKEVLVRPDGGIAFPLVGDLQAAGKTAQELQREIVRRLEKYIPDAVVSVAVLKVASNKIYVIGRVNKPGEYITGRYVDVLQALSMAGGLTPFASEDNIKIVRKEQGKEVVFRFRYSQVKNGTDLEQNIVLKGGDVVVVP
jgi:polysaccharide export outer membrane protein